MALTAPVKPRHYFIRSLEFIEEMTKVTNPTHERWVEEFKSLHKFFSEQTTCWHLDTNALQLAWFTDLDAETLGTIRLPWPAIAIEYDFYNSLLGLPPVPEGLNQCPQRCTIAIDMMAMQQWYAEQLGITYKYADTKYDGIMLYNFFKDDKVWGLTPYTMRIRYSDLPKFTLELTSRGVKEIKADFGGIIPSLTLHEMARRSNRTIDEMMEEVVEKANILDDLRVTLALLQLLLCTNSPPVHTVPAPAKLNAKRVSRGHAAIPAYRTLHLAPARRQNRSTGAVTAPSGRTVRAHIRRGHVRRQWYATEQAHKPVWIEPTWVNCAPGEQVTPRDLDIRR